MNRLAECFERLRADNRKALVTYIVSGDPDLSLTVPAMHRMVEAGADIIELGVPFSDPMAEGPVIQKGHERALLNHVSLRDTLAQVEIFRRTDPSTPVVLMGYANPVERMGYSLFADKAAEAGVDGLITVDLPPEEATEFNALFRARGLETIYLLAPTSSEARVKTVTELAGGFLYYVSLKGVTGAANLDVASVTEKLERIRKHSKLPVCVGFGIKDAASAKAVSSVADGVVVGSALVEIMGQGGDADVILAGLAEKVASIRQALD